MPLANVTVALVDKDLSVTTGVDGYYLIEDLEAGAYAVSCFTTGYNIPQPVTDDIAAGESVVIDFSLVPADQVNN